VVLLVKEEIGYWDSNEKQSLFSTYVGLVASAVHGVRLMDMTRRAAVTDGLTGVYNRRFFDEMLEKQILLARRNKKPLSLIIMDIDHFKNFNDTYGHITGDRVLKQLTTSVKGSIRESDILARYGGEEFVVIMPDASLSNALKKADAVRHNIESMALDNIVSGQTLSMTISIGVASFPEHGVDPNALIASADSALYKAKESGRNRVEAP
jgi:diguanylate cyclase (GGDEF)-like protein